MQPVLFCAAVFWTPDFWSKSTHAWDWVQAETPLDEKPWAELEISIDVTLGEVLEAACDAWGIEAGPDLLKHGGTARASSSASDLSARIETLMEWTPRRPIDGRPFNRSPEPMGPWNLPQPWTCRTETCWHRRGSI